MKDTRFQTLPHATTRCHPEERGISGAAKAKSDTTEVHAKRNAAPVQEIPSCLRMTFEEGDQQLISNTTSGTYILEIKDKPQMPDEKGLWWSMIDVFCLYFRQNRTS